MPRTLFQGQVAMRLFGYRPTQKPFQQWKIVLGDQVMVNSGAYRGATGKVTAIHRKKNMVTV